MRFQKVTLLMLVASGCGATTSTTADTDEELDDVSAELAELRRLGDIAAGEYLFASDALAEASASRGGTRDGSTPLSRARLVAVEPDAFVVSVDGGPHRRVPRREAWPMACLRSSLEHAEGDLAVQLGAGAPVFVLASTEGGARVSVMLTMEHSSVVSRRTLALEGCTQETPTGRGGGVASVSAGDVACLFPDQETLDLSAGLPIPTGAPLRVLDEEGAWARVELRAPGGTVRGWMGASLVGDAAGTPNWIGTALASAQCVFPGRVGARADSDVGGERGDPPSIPPSEIERVVRNNSSQIEACYLARLSDVPDLRVTMDVVMMVDPDGQVQTARITRGASADEGLSRCVVERVRRWRFPAPRLGSVEVRRTFTLRPPAP